MGSAITVPRTFLPLSIADKTAFLKFSDNSSNPADFVDDDDVTIYDGIDNRGDANLIQRFYVHAVFTDAVRLI